MPKDLWEFSTGLRDDVDAEIVSVVFGTDAQIQDGAQVLAKVTFKDLNETGPSDEAEFTQFYSVGKGFEPGPKGATLVREDGRDLTLPNVAGVNAQTAYATFLKAMALADESVRGKVNPYDGQTMVGLSYHLEQGMVTGGEFTKEPRKFTGRDGNPVEITWLLPVSVVGAASTSEPAKSEKKPSKAEQAKAKAAAAKTKTDAAPAAAANGAHPALAKLSAADIGELKAAAQSPDHDTWMERAFMVDAVSDGGEVEAAVMDDSEAGLFAHLRG